MKLAIALPFMNNGSVFAWYKCCPSIE